MSDAGQQTASVAVLGLGRMGITIARTLASAGTRVDGWNRTNRRDLVPGTPGLTIHAGVRDAVEAAQLIVCVPLSYENTREALGPVAAQGALAGKVVLNLSWGSTDEAADMQAWCHEAGAAYLDGSLLCYPDEIGTAAGRLVYSGDPDAGEWITGVVEPLGSVRFLGTDVHAANAVGTAAGVVFYHAALAGFYEAIGFASRFGVSPSALLPEIRAMLHLLGTHVVADVSRIGAHDYDDSSASIQVHLDGARIAIEDSDAIGQPASMMRGFVNLLQPVADAGHGDQSIARLFEYLTDPRGR